MRTYFVETWGCQMNSHDSERLQGRLRMRGMEPVPTPSEADLVLLNTCSVRERPVQKLLSRIAEVSRDAPGARIGVCGCVAQQEGDRLLSRSPAVAFVLGPGQVGRVGEALDAAQAGQRPVLTGFDPEAEHHFETIFRTSDSRGMVTVIEGCDEFCTFCVVPYTRGRERNRPAADVVAEVRELGARSVGEIELLGQTINAYRCPETGADFAELLRQVCEVPGPRRIRYVTSHPRHFSDRLIAVIADQPKVSRYLHLPFQSGSDRILRRMNRKYGRQEYLDLIGRIRAAVPDINLSTDVIVGFPGESEDDFRATLDLLAEVRFGQTFAFAYSPRPKTPAARYDEQVPPQVKKERLHRLFEMTDGISRELNEALVGSTVEVLVDGPSRRGDGWQGRTDGNRVVNLPLEAATGAGEWVDAAVRSATAHSLRAEPRLASTAAS